MIKIGSKAPKHFEGMPIAFSRIVLYLYGGMIDFY